MIRNGMAQPGDSSAAHLGEAETIAVIRTRQLPAMFVTDDRDAARAARDAQLRTVDTCQMLKLAVRLNRITEDEFLGYVLVLRSRGRATPRAVADLASAQRWLAAP